jgi:hypothetical protein
MNACCFLADAAEKLLELGLHEDCALSLFFISDGLPTDAGIHGLTPAAALRHMNEKVSKIAARFVDQLNIQFVGFGGTNLDFFPLEAMVKAANNAAGVETAKFCYCDKLAHSIGNAVSSLASSTMVTKTALASGVGRLTAKNKRSDIISEADAGSHGWNYFKIINQYVYHPKLDDWIFFGGLPPGAMRKDNIVEAEKRFKRHQLPPFLAMKKGYCGVSDLGTNMILLMRHQQLIFSPCNLCTKTGVERVAYRCHLADAANTNSFQFGDMVAKETLRADRIDERISFHKLFCETQSVAAHLADQFNKRLRGLPHYCKQTTPRVSFLKCSVLVLEDPAWPGGNRGVLVEKQLDTSRFEWKKWNNNFGGIDGKISHRPMDVDLELAQIEQELLEGNSNMMIIEEDSEQENSDEDSGGDNEDDDESVDMEQKDGLTDPYSPSDYLQAFS